MINLKGNYQIEIEEGGKTIFDSGEFGNIITDHAKQYGDPFSSGYLCIGFETTPKGPDPSYLDIDLHNPVTSKATSFSSDLDLIVIGGKRYAKKKSTASFTGLNGNISEVGFKKADNSTSMVSRCWVRDGNGLETVIPVKPIQTLSISYFVYIEVPEVINTGSIQTQYGNVSFRMISSPEITKPKGYLAGNFERPFGFSSRSVRLVIEGITDPLVDVSEILYDSITSKTTMTFNFVADSFNRVLTAIRSTESDYKNYILVVFDTPIIIPADNDLTMTIDLQWGRG